MKLKSDLDNESPLNVLWKEECNLLLVAYSSLHMLCKQIFSCLTYPNIFSHVNQPLFIPSLFSSSTSEQDFPPHHALPPQGPQEDLLHRL